MKSTVFKNMDHDECVSLTRAIMSILDSWGLAGDHQLAVLCLPKGTPKRALRRYREDTPFPDDEHVSQRIEHIVGIADALRTSYPHNPAMGVIWMKQQNQRFEDRSPLQTIVEGGLQGLMEVRAHLDCAYDWHINP